MMVRSSAPLSYEQARGLATQTDSSLRASVAARPDAPPEVLYFLASDDSSAVRRAVAANAATPSKGNLLLAGDPLLEVRLDLAAKIGRHGRFAGAAALQGSARRTADQVTAQLAHDPDMRVRAVIATVLRDAIDADPAVVRLLAGDRQIVVAAPVLQYSPVLTDDDLLAIIAAEPVAGRLAAIARRARISDRVMAAIVASGDVPAVVHLLGNADANSQEETLDILIADAATRLGWQEPPLYHRDLSEASAQRLIDMVTAHVLDRVAVGQDLTEEGKAALASVVEERVRHNDGRRWGGVALPLDAGSETHYAGALDHAQALRDAGRLDEMAMMVALLTDRDEELVAGLAVRAGIPLRTVLRIVAAQSARAMCALAWKAGLSAAFALELQMRLSGVAAAAAQQPAEGGGYALDDSEMIWQLDMFTASPEDPSRGH